MCCVNEANDYQDLHKTAKKLPQAKIEFHQEGF